MTASRDSRQTFKAAGRAAWEKKPAVLSSQWMTSTTRGVSVRCQMGVRISGGSAVNKGKCCKSVGTTAEDMIDEFSQEEVA